MNQYILLLEQKGIFNQRLAIVRLLLALSALLTILFNDVNYMTDFNLIQSDETTFTAIVFFKQFSIFSLFTPNFAKIFSILILLSVLTGYLPQINCFLQAWIHLSICNSFLGVDGGDQIASNLSLLLIPICLFDNRLNQWDAQKNIETNRRKAINVFLSCYFILILLQVAIIYLHAAIGKLHNNEWKDGTCAYYWFTNNVFGAPIYMQKFYNLLTLSSFTPIITWSVIILELGLFACILATDKKIKLFFLIFGILFHFIIAITHGLITFFFSMAAALILYLDSENITYQYIKQNLNLHILKNNNQPPSEETKNQWHKDPNNWKLGLFYYNPDDKRIFPPKKTKQLGWTINFANANSIFIIVVIIIILIILGENINR